MTWPGAPWRPRLAGQLELGEIDSAALSGNPLGDPAHRPVLVYLPPGYDDGDQRYPSVYVLQALTGQLDMWSNRRAFRPTYPEAVDEVFADGAVPPCVVVFVDAWTSLGGSQFLDSPAVGRYQTYLSDDVVGWVDARYRTLADARHRGLGGHSSGGYGAMVSALLRPDVWSGVASHAGDARFEDCYRPGFRDSVRTLTGAYDGSWERWWADVEQRGLLSRESDFSLLNDWCMAACYSADPDGTVHLPFHPRTGDLVPEVWERWLAWDPVRMIPARTEAVRSWRGVWLDAGTRDEVYLDLGAAALDRALRAAGVGDDVLHFELHDGRHGDQQHRFPHGLRWLATHLAP